MAWLRDGYTIEVRKTPYLPAVLELLSSGAEKATLYVGYTSSGKACRDLTDTETIRKLAEQTLRS
jgi:hypothetical protein